MYYVYLLESVRYDEIYIGSTNDLQRRFGEHNAGKEISTKRYLPWRLVSYEAYQSEQDARHREKMLKQHGNAMKQFKLKSVNSFVNRKLSPSTTFFVEESGVLSPKEKGLPSTIFFRKKSSAGFTITEVLIVLAIVLVISAVSLPLVGNWSSSAKTDGAKFALEQNLRLAWVRARAYYKNQSHGLKLLSTGYVLFQGNDYTGRQTAYDLPVNFDSGLSLSWQLNGNGQADEIVFATSTGEPSRFGQMVITTDQASSTVNLNALGLIE